MINEKSLNSLNFVQNQSALLYSWEDELSKCSFKPVEVARDWDLLRDLLSSCYLEALDLNCSKIFYLIIEAQVLNDVVVVST